MRIVLLITIIITIFSNQSFGGNVEKDESLYALRTLSEPPISVRYPTNLEEWVTWRDQSIKALLNPRFVNGNTVIDSQQVMAQSVAIANFIDDFSPFYNPKDELDSKVANLRDFTKLFRNNLSIPAYDHQFGYTIDDFQYLENTRENVDLPPLLKSASFLSNVSNRETYKQAYNMIIEHNKTLPSAKQWVVLVYKSRFLTTPDDAGTFGRFFVYVPEDRFDKWIQFGIKIPGDNSTVPINNFSIVSVANPDDQGRRFNAIIDWWRSYKTGWSVDLKTRRESQGVTENCVMCHKTSPLGIHPAEVYVFDTNGNLCVNTTNADIIPQKLNTLIAGYGTPYFNGWADTTKYGPPLGPDISRSDAAIKAWASDQNLSQDSINKVKAAMNCSLCHSQTGLGPLNYPEATRHLKTQGNQIYQYITQGWMPPRNKLLPNEREALYESLMKEYYDFDKNEGLFIDWLKNESVLKMSLFAIVNLSSGSGEKDYNNNCLVCHPNVSGQHDYGPSLFGVVGRVSGTASGYAYSSSYIEAGTKGVVWDERNLFQFLAEPVTFLSQEIGHPAISKMQKHYPDETLRTNIIEYLKTLE
ncbi:MAG: hypothetical protein JWR19_4107 [Pedosphaera sp.]|nr:hypothetical protein [Pedosphaera sp.]